jgi:hypothetical protein
MSVGFELYRLQKRLVLKLYYFMFGTLDLHSHIRYRAIKRYFKSVSTIDIGAGDGHISLAFRRNIKKPITILCYTDQEYYNARKTSIGLQDVKVIKGTHGLCLLTSQIKALSKFF